MEGVWEGEAGRERRPALVLRSPDVRALEEGNSALAADEKHRLEQKQRAARKQASRAPLFLSPLAPSRTWARRLKCPPSLLMLQGTALHPF